MELLQGHEESTSNRIYDQNVQHNDNESGLFDLSVCSISLMYVYLSVSMCAQGNVRAFDRTRGYGIELSLSLSAVAYTSTERRPSYGHSRSQRASIRTMCRDPRTEERDQRQNRRPAVEKGRKEETSIGGRDCWERRTCARSPALGNPRLSAML